MPRRRRLPITTVVFDLDDTLYDCYRQRVLVAHRYASKKMLAAGLRRSTGRRLTIASVFRLRLRLFREERNLDTLDRRLCARLGLQGKLAERIARVGYKAYFTCPVGRLRLLPDSLPTLQRLHRCGVRLFILTAGDLSVQRTKVRKLGLDRLPYVQQVFYTGLRMGRGKIQRLRQVLRYEPNPEKVLVVGDRPDSEIRAARELGMRAVRRVGGEFARTQPRHRLERPDFTIRRLSQLFSLGFRFGPEHPVPPRASKR
jgi:FMN phosphatase YigB (HAD superfamily)